MAVVTSRMFIILNVDFLYFILYVDFHDGPIYIAQAWTHIRYLLSERQKAYLAVSSMPRPLQGRLYRFVRPETVIPEHSSLLDLLG